jgi:hypothetical protein
VKIEVRCCCDPEKILGWVPAPDDVRRGDIIQFVVSPRRWRQAWIGATPSFEPLDTISLPAEEIRTYVNGEPVVSIALKSEETSLERLRLIRGFVDHHNA